jgi:hypothetical protein
LDLGLGEERREDGAPEHLVKALGARFCQPPVARFLSTTVVSEEMSIIDRSVRRGEVHN